jgi:hypothetical protein
MDMVKGLYMIGVNENQNIKIVFFYIKKNL